MEKIKLVGFVFLSMVPVVASAKTFKEVLTDLMGQIDILPTFLVGLAGIYFMYNVYKYVKSGSAKEVEEATKMITYSIVFIFVMISVWGLVSLLVNTLGLGTPQSVTVPKIPKPN